MNNINVQRIICTPSDFAKESLLYAQEVGISKTNEKHTSLRTNLDSYLFFIVLEGNGSINYKDVKYSLNKGDCVFLDCKYSNSHTSDNWKIMWVHFNGISAKYIFDKYLLRNGKFVFNTSKNLNYEKSLENIISIASSSDYLKDMKINNELSNLLTLIMSETIYDDGARTKYNLEEIRNYLDNNFSKDISLDSLSKIFFINKFYLTRAFKDKYGKTINNYINEKRINKAKELLRYTEYSYLEIAKECGIEDQNYFSRLFKKIEGVTPSYYQQHWD